MASRDAAAVGLAGYTSGMGPLLGHWIAAGRVDGEPEIARTLAAHLSDNAVRAERLARETERTVAALCEAGVEVVVLKGQHTARSHFPAPATRPCSDIDLLVAAAGLSAWLSAMPCC